MKLRAKTVLIVITTIVCLLAILYTLSGRVILAGFLSVEKRDTQRNISRVLDAIKEDISQFSIKAADWAKWDDTYQFVVDSNQEYIESNLTDNSLTDLGLDLMLFVDTTGKPVFGKSIGENGEGTDLPSPILRAILSDSTIMHHPDEQSVVAGFTMIAQQLMLVVSRPILTSAGEGPSHGTLIFGRMVDSVEIEKISRITHLALTVAHPSATTLGADMARAQQKLSSDHPMFTSPLSRGIIAGYAHIPDIRGKPVLLARINVPRDIYRQGRLTRWYLLISILAAGIALGIAILLLLEHTVLAPIARLTTDVTVIGTRGDHTYRVEVRGRDEVARLAQSTNTMLDALHSIENQVSTRNRQMRLIMNAVPTGLLSLDEHNRVNPEYSASVEGILEIRDLQGIDFCEAVGLSGEKRDEVLEYLDLMRGEKLSEEDLAGLNPLQEAFLTIGNGKWITTHFTLIRRDQGLPSHILVVMEDITQRTAMQASIALKEQENLQLKAIAEDPDLFRDFLRETRQILSHAEQKISSLTTIDQKREIINEVFRDIHTIKGTAGAFGLSVVADVAGAMEESLGRLRGDNRISLETISHIRHSFDQLSKAITEAITNARNLFGDEMLENSTDLHLRVSLDKIKHQSALLRQLVDRHLVENSEGKEIIEALNAALCQSRCIPARKGFAKVLKIIPGLSRRLEKPIHFDIVGGETPLDYEIAHKLNNALVHLVRNCVDHGIEPAHERRARGKPEQGLVKISIKNNGRLTVRVEDDGRGIDPEHIKRSAVEKGFLDPNIADRLSEREALNLIFAHGFSTAQSVTDISGRGVGMDAVQVTVQSLGGDVEVHSQQGSGTVFEIRLPSAVPS